MVKGLAARETLHLDERPFPAQVFAQRRFQCRRGVGAQHQRHQLATAAEHPVEQPPPDRLQVGADQDDLAVREHPELELGVGEDDPRPLADRGAVRVQGERRVADRGLDLGLAGAYLSEIRPNGAQVRLRLSPGNTVAEETPKRASTTSASTLR